MRSFFRSLPVVLVCSISLYSGVVQASPEIYQSMSTYLSQKYDLFIKKLADQYNTQLQDMRNGKLNLLRSELEQGQRELNEETSEKNNQLLAKKSLLDERIKKYNTDLNRLNQKIDQLKAVQASSVQVQQAEVDRLNREIFNLGEHLNDEVKPYLDNRDESNKIAKQHTKLIDEIHSGQHPTRVEILQLKDDFNAYAQRQNDEIQEQLQIYNQKFEELNQWIDREKRFLEEITDTASRLADDYNNYIQVVNEKIKQYNARNQTQQHRPQCCVHYAGSNGSARTEVDQNLREVNYAKEALEQKKRNFEAQKNRLNQERARIQREKDKKEDLLTDSKNKIFAFQDRVNDEVSRKKAEIEGKIQRLQNGLESAVTDLTDKFERLKNSLNEEYGPNCKQFMTLYSEWIKGEKLKVNEIINQCGPDFGKRGGGIVQCIAQLESLSQERLTTLTQFSQRSLETQGLKTQIDSLGDDLKSRDKAIEDLRSHIDGMRQGFNQELNEKARASRQKAGIDKQKLAQAEETLLHLFKQRARIAELEMNILAQVILAKTVKATRLESRVCDYNQACFEFDVKAGSFKEYYEVDLLRKEMLFDYVRAAAEDIPGPNEDWIDYTQEKVLEKAEVTGIVKKGLISEWYATLHKKNVLIDCNPLLQICSTGVGEKEFNEFRMALFQNGLFVDSHIYRIKFDNGNLGFQVELNEKTYWLGKKGDLKEFVIERPKAASSSEDEVKAKADSSGSDQSQDKSEGSLKGFRYFKCENPEQYDGHEFFGNKECVTFVKAVAGVPSNPRLNWMPGPLVKGNKDIEMGTAIATFTDEGIYPNWDSGNHAAIYLEQTESAIRVVHQYCPHKESDPKTVNIKDIHFKGKKIKHMSNDGDYYYVITSKR